MNKDDLKKVAIELFELQYEKMDFTDMIFHSEW